MTSPTLADIDQAFVQAPHCWLVDDIQWQIGGVDPLGLRQINLDLMDSMLPGINNVTDKVRPYTFMTWAWWKAAQTIEATGASQTDTATLQEIVDRLEVLFVWSHFLAEDYPGLPGRTVVGDELGYPGSSRTYFFGGASWQRFREKRRANTGLMSATQYGPSIRALDWLENVMGAFRPTPDAMAAVEALDARISPYLPDDLLSPRPGAIDIATAESVYERWRSTRLIKAERRTFKKLFYDIGVEATTATAAGRRRLSLDLIRSVLGQADQPLTIDAIRRRMACAQTPNGRLEFDEDLTERHQRWAALQARQLQRLALESLFRWTENNTDEHGLPSEEIAAAAHDAACEEEDGADASSVGDYLDLARQRAGRRGWPGACGTGGKADIFDLMAEIDDAQRNDEDRIPGLALRAIAYADAVTRSLKDLGTSAGPAGPLGGHLDRLPLAAASERLRLGRERPMTTLWLEIIESWVIGQHVRWSVARNGDGTQRLRVALGDHGWMRLRGNAQSGAVNPTADRLRTALALASDCEVIRLATKPDDDETLYTM